MSSEKALLSEQTDGILVLTFNRPDRGNVIDYDVSVALGAALADADADPAIHVVIITGEGDRAFCLGADMAAMVRGEPLRPMEGPAAAWGFGGFVHHHISKPIIVALNGDAFGGGAELLLTADLAVMAEHARIGFPEVRKGVIAGAGGLVRVPRQVPSKIAHELILLGEPMSADRALQYGLVNRVTSANELLDVAIAMARVIAEAAAPAVQASKRVIRGIVDGAIPAEADAFAASDAVRMTIGDTPEAQAGMASFADTTYQDWYAR